MRRASVVVVLSPSKLSDEVATTSVSHRLDPADGQSDPTVPRSLSSSESASRPQPLSHDEPYEHPLPERPYYDAVPLPPQLPLPSQPPSGMHSG